MNLINQLLTAREQQRLELRALNLSEPQIEKVLRSFDNAVAQYRLVPVKVTEPSKNLHEALDFDDELIEEAMKMGRDYVADKWPELEQFLGV